MNIYEQITFPYSKIIKNSKVVIYGGGRIGKFLYQENTKSNYCEMIAVIDKNKSQRIGDLQTIGVMDLSAIDFDYVILCSTRQSGEEEMCEELFNMKVPSEKIVFLHEESIKVKKNSLENNSFHHLIVEPQYRDMPIEESLKVVKRYKSCQNCLKSTDKFSKLLLLGYEYYMPVFHIVDEDNHYEGTIDKNVINDISNIMKFSISGDITIEKVMTLLHEHNIELNISSESSISVYSVYKKFLQESYLLEIPLIKDGKLVDVIKRADFEAFFSKERVRDDMPYISTRYKGVKVGLEQYAYNVNSQWGEDGIIEYIFEKLGLKSNYAVEFGGWDGVFLSNIRKLILEKNMNAVFIEGDQQKAEDGRSNYKGNEKVKFINSYVGFERNRLDEILKDNDVPTNIDLLSIDVDGYDYQIWNSLKNYRPRVVIVEYNPSVSNEIVFINPNNESLLCGSSALAFVELAKRKGYELAAVTDANCIFVVQEEFEKLEIFDNSLDNLRRGKKREAYQLISTYRGDVFNDPWRRDGFEVLWPLRSSM